MSPMSVLSAVSVAVCLVSVAAHGEEGTESSCCGAWKRYCVYAFAVVGALSLGTWFLTVLYNMTCSRRPQNLKKKYNAKWALVTGGSSGIGRALVERLAADGLNIVIVGLADKLLDDTMEFLNSTYPDQQFRQVGVNLGSEVSDSYMGPIKETTADLTIQIIFCNAGFMTTGFFTEVSFGRQVANFHCNATSGMHISHHFVQRLRNSGKRGCVCFTSSPAAFLPTPFSVIYGSTKAFLTEFAASLAPEVRRDGIDVMVFHPSPVATRFYDKAHKFGALEMFKATAVTPGKIADCMLASVGHLVVRDQGYYPTMMRVLLKIMDSVFLTEIIARTAHTSADFKKLAPPPVSKKSN